MNAFVVTTLTVTCPFVLSRYGNPFCTTGIIFFTCVVTLVALRQWYYRNERHNNQPSTLEDPKSEYETVDMAAGLAHDDQEDRPTSATTCPRALEIEELYEFELKSMADGIGAMDIAVAGD